jgi:hypothetical protein
MGNETIRWVDGDGKELPGWVEGATKEVVKTSEYIPDQADLDRARIAELKAISPLSASEQREAIELLLKFFV